jgi:hypothetical protein
MNPDMNVTAEDFPKFIQLRGVQIISRFQLSILLALYDVNQPGALQIFKTLPVPVGKLRAAGFRASLKSLRGRDWIVSTRDDCQHRLTLRGFKVVKDVLQRCYPKTEWRRKKLCCRCKQNPRVQRPSFLHSWCKECIQKIQRRSEDLGLRRANPHLPCARCKDPDLPRYISANGFVSQYCESCKVAVAREKRVRRQARDRQRIEDGEAVLCKCGQPVYVTANYVSKRCKDCERSHTSKGRSQRAPKKR